MIKLALSLTEPYRVISRYDSAIDLPPEPNDPMPQRTDGESDEAFEARAKAWAAPIREWGKPLRTARETGDYSAILKAGETPSAFIVRQVTATEWAKIDAASGRLQARIYNEVVQAQYVAGMPDEMIAEMMRDASRRFARALGHLLVRYAVEGIENAPAAATFARAEDPAFPELGPIQPTAFVDLFTGSERILMEIAEVVGERRHTPPN